MLENAGNSVSAASPGVGLGPLAVARQAVDVPESAVALNVGEPLQISVHVRPQLDSDGVFRELFAEEERLSLSQLSRRLVVDPYVRQDLPSSRPSDPVDVLKRHLQLLLVWNLHSGFHEHGSRFPAMDLRFPIQIRFRTVLCSDAAQRTKRNRRKKKKKN